MTPENSEWAAERVWALRDRAEGARARAALLCGAAAESVEALKDLLTRRRESAFPAEPGSVRLARSAVAELAAAAGVAG